MSGFRLSALLRLRSMQEDDALAGFGRAQQTLASAGAAATAARKAVRAVGPAPSGPAAVFLAGAAARAALAVAVTESVALEEAAARDVDAARGAWQDARSRSRAVGRLAEKYEEERRGDMARREQAQADELTSARWKGTEDTHE
jgi:flagellar protein FliJ